MKLWFVLIGLLLVSACIPFTDESGSNILVRSGVEGFSAERQLAVEASPQTMLKAMVKGSIYETGEEVSVFGTCLNATDEPLTIGTFATMNSWYPNGTIFFTNVSMFELQSGYYVYTGVMSAVQGTYLTELICHVNGTGETAKAWGEWQNPAWVALIGTINGSMSNISYQLSNISSQVSNVSIQLANFTLHVDNQFNQTWAYQNQTNLLINATYNNLSQQITVVGQIANASVDRNDSYLAGLILSLLPGASNSSLNYTVDSEDAPIFMKTWSIQVTARNSAGKVIQYPDSYCTISTNLPSPVVQMTSQGNHFVYSILINRLGDFTYTVACYWS